MSTTKKLTIIDDDETFIYLTQKTIAQTNLVQLIRIFGNGLDAIEFLAENKGKVDVLPEIILLDLSMPIMDGWQFLDAFTNLNPKIGKKITIYICSSSISPDDIEKAKTISAVTDYIIKPITKDKLIDMIARL